MTTHAEVEAAQSIARQAVSATLEDNSLRLVVLHHSIDDGFEDGLVGLVGYSVAKREVHSIVLTDSYADIPEFAGTGEVFSILVKRNRHDTISGVEGLLNAIAVMNINIDVQNTLLVS